MAGSNYSLNVQDRASVEDWKQRAQKLNEAAERTIREAAQALDEFKDTAEGNVFEQVCQYSGQVISGMTQVMQGMNEILNAVDKMINMLVEKGKELVDGVIGVVGKVFG